MMKRSSVQKSLKRATKPVEHRKSNPSKQLYQRSPGLTQKPSENTITTNQKEIEEFIRLESRACLSQFKDDIREPEYDNNTIFDMNRFPKNRDKPSSSGKNLKSRLPQGAETRIRRNFENLREKKPQPLGDHDGQQEHFGDNSFGLFGSSRLLLPEDEVSRRPRKSRPHRDAPDSQEMGRYRESILGFIKEEIHKVRSSFDSIVQAVNEVQQEIIDMMYSNMCGVIREVFSDQPACVYHYRTSVTSRIESIKRLLLSDVFPVTSVRFSPQMFGLHDVFLGEGESRESGGRSREEQESRMESVREESDFRRGEGSLGKSGGGDYNGVSFEDGAHDSNGVHCESNLTATFLKKSSSATTVKNFRNDSMNYNNESNHSNFVDHFVSKMDKRMSIPKIKDHNIHTVNRIASPHRRAEGIFPYHNKQNKCVQLMRKKTNPLVSSPKHSSPLINKIERPIYEPQPKLSKMNHIQRKNDMNRNKQPSYTKDKERKEDTKPRIPASFYSPRNTLVSIRSSPCFKINNSAKNSNKKDQSPKSKINPQVFNPSFAGDEASFFNIRPKTPINNEPHRRNAKLFLQSFDHKSKDSLNKKSRVKSNSPPLLSKKNDGGSSYRRKGLKYTKEKDYKKENLRELGFKSLRNSSELLFSIPIDNSSIQMSKKRELFFSGQIQPTFLNERDRSLNDHLDKKLRKDSSYTPLF